MDGGNPFERPIATFHNDHNTNRDENLALWTEAGWFSLNEADGNVPGTLLCTTGFAT